MCIRDRIRKEISKVLAEVNDDRSILQMIRRRRAKLITHVLGLLYSQFLPNIVEGKMLRETKRTTKSSVLQTHGKGDELSIAFQFKEDND